jgi:hypothetical protein
MTEEASIRRAAPPDGAAPPKRWRTTRELLALSLCVLCAAWVFSRAVGSFFSPDDLIHLEQASGLAPTPIVPWRVLTQVVYFRVMLAGFGLHPVPYLLLNLLLHLVNTALVYFAARRIGLARSAGIVAAVLFGTYPPFITVLARAVTINDIAALMCAFAVAGLLRAGRSATAAALFAVGMLCKESILFLPLASLALVDDPLRLHRRVGWAVGMVAFFVLLFGALHPFGLATSGPPYEIGFGVPVIQTLMTYLAWAFRVGNPLPDLVRSYDPHAWRLGMWVVLAWLGAAIVFRSGPRGRAIRGGAVWWGLGLLPVLLLKNSTYSHYMYVAMPGLTIAVAATLASLVGVRDPAQDKVSVPVREVRRRWSATASTVLVLSSVCWAAWADHLLATRVTLVVPGANVPLDPFFRGMLTAYRTITSVGRSLPAEPVDILMISPPGAMVVLGARSGRQYPIERHGRAYNLVEAVVDSGRALRLFYPQIRSVAFVDHWDSRYARYAIFVERGPQDFVGFGSGAVAQARVARSFIERSEFGLASAWLNDALSAYPNDLALLTLDRDIRSGRSVAPGQGPPR